MSAVAVERGVSELEAAIARVLDRATQSGVAASATGSPLGRKLDALGTCLHALRRAAKHDDCDVVGGDLALQRDGR